MQLEETGGDKRLALWVVGIVCIGQWNVLELDVGRDNTGIYTGKAHGAALVDLYPLQRRETPPSPKGPADEGHSEGHSSGDWHAVAPLGSQGLPGAPRGWGCVGNAAGSSLTPLGTCPHTSLSVDAGCLLPHSSAPTHACVTSSRSPRSAAGGCCRSLQATCCVFSHSSLCPRSSASWLR